MAEDSTNSIDSEFQAFLDDVEQLSLHHGSITADGTNNDGSKEAAEESNDDDDNSQKPSTGVKSIGVDTNKNSASSANISRSSKKNMIANASGNQSAWSEFKKLDLSTSSASNTTSKVSFQIKSAKEKKKKKKSTTTNKASIDPAKELVEETHGAPFSETMSPLSNIEELSRPRWTLVIDTCCLLDDNGMGVQNLIDLASHAADAQFRAQNQQSSLALTTTTVEESIDIVMPFKVHSELEYQSKSAESNIAFAARTAIRMLRDEMESGNAYAKGGNECNVLRSQSLLESREAAATFLPKDSQSTNDDHILSCAMMENEKFKQIDPFTSSNAVGGVVVVTVDNNLACKAYANGLQVKSPSQFRQYYQKRMSSLRQRATGRLTDSALRR